MHLRLVCTLVLFAVPACASHEDGSRPTSPTKVADADPEPADVQPEPQPEPEPEPEPRAKASIASVQMIQDCPDPAPPAVAPASQPVPAGAAAPKPTKPAAEPSPKRSARAARGTSLGGKGPRQPCTQSTMQLAFAGQGDAPGRVAIHNVTILDAQSADVLGTVAARRPMTWVDGSYRAWDEVLPAGEATKASYSLRVPNWSDVEAKIGGTSFGHMFVVEVELTIDGERQTVRSPAFTRERPHVLVT
jgi:hypothetical protein